MRTSKDCGTKRRAASPRITTKGREEEKMKEIRSPEPTSPKAYFLRREAVRIKRYDWSLKDQVFLVDMITHMERGFKLTENQYAKLARMIASKTTAKDRRIQAAIDALKESASVAQ